MHPFFSRFTRPDGGGNDPRLDRLQRFRAHVEDLHDRGHERFERHAGPRGPRGPRGFDFFGGPRGGRGSDDGFDDPRGRAPGARPLGHGDLRLLMLSLIAEQPRHGYELIRLIEALFHGAYSPSPGAIYPTLSQLEDMGLIAAAPDEGRKRYAITEEGRQHVEAARGDIEAALARAHRSAKDIAKAQVPAPIRAAFHRIKHGLLRRHGRWSEAEIARVAALLDAVADAMEDRPQD